MLDECDLFAPADRAPRALDDADDRSGERRPTGQLGGAGLSGLEPLLRQPCPDAGAILGAAELRPLVHQSETVVEDPDPGGAHSVVGNLELGHRLLEGSLGPGVLRLGLVHDRLALEPVVEDGLDAVEVVLRVGAFAAGGLHALGSDDLLVRGDALVDVDPLIPRAACGLGRQQVRARPIPIEPGLLQVAAGRFVHHGEDLLVLRDRLPLTDVDLADPSRPDRHERFDRPGDHGRLNLEMEEAPIDREQGESEHDRTDDEIEQRAAGQLACPLPGAGGVARQRRGGQRMERDVEVPDGVADHTDLPAHEPREKVLQQLLLSLSQFQVSCRQRFGIGFHATDLDLRVEPDLEPVEVQHEAHGPLIAGAGRAAIALDAESPGAPLQRLVANVVENHGRGSRDSVVLP